MTDNDTNRTWWQGFRGNLAPISRSLAVLLLLAYSGTLTAALWLLLFDSSIPSQPTELQVWVYALQLAGTLTALAVTLFGLVYLCREE